MKIKSTEFNDYYFLPKASGYKFGNKAPTLYVEDIPPNTSSLALVVYDSDVLYNNVELTHWLVWNLPVDIGEFSADNLPEGAVQGTNDMGTVGYAGPILAREVHHINFLIYAINHDLVLDSSSKRSLFDQAVNANFIDHASLIGIIQADS